jgi:hypothetical protein
MHVEYDRLEQISVSSPGFYKMYARLHTHTHTHFSFCNNNPFDNMVQPKVKLSLCLTKYHPMKVYPPLN